MHQIVREPCKGFHEPFNSCNLHVMPRSCLICSDNTKLQLAADMVNAGASDQAIADRLGSLSRMAVRRHRENHIAAPLQHRLAIAAKGSEHVRERQALAQAAAADAPSPQQFADAVLGLRAQAEKLERIEGRLERMATIAEAGGSHSGVAALAGQQIRSVEVGARLAGVGGYAPRAVGEGTVQQPVSITINFAGEGESITIAPVTTFQPDDTD